MQTSKSAFPLLIFILSGKGGVGKTLLSLLLVDLLELNGIPVDVVQVDDQSRLSKSLGRQVTSIEIALLKRARKDPTALTGAFAPFYNFLAEIPNSGRSLLVDVGATQQHLLLDYAALTELEDDLQEFGIRTVALIPVVVDPESIEQAARQLEALKRIVPSASPFLVFNERDGSFSRIAAGSVAADFYRQKLEPFLPSVRHIIMPRIEAGSWGYFERQQCRLIDVVGFDVPTAMAVSGLSRPEAKLARGDVAAWLQTMEHAVASILPLPGDA